MGALGRALKAISYYDEDANEVIKLKGNWKPGQPYWAIYYNKTPAPVGIDGLYLQKNDAIELHYTLEEIN